MKYKLVCIYQHSEGGEDHLRVEVCNDTGHKSLGPFVRRVGLDALYVDSVDGQKDMVAMLSQSGTTEQSGFEITNEDFLHNQQVARLLNAQTLNYRKGLTGGSLKRISHPAKGEDSNCIPLGSLIGGELYLDDIKDWPSRIRVKLRYAETHATFFASPNIDVFVSDSSTLRRRNLQAEDKLLRDLYDVGYKAGDAFLDLSASPSVYLQKLLDAGWKFFLPKGSSRGRKSVVSHTSQTGITWFAAEDEPVDGVGDKFLLDAFLNSRNYAEYNKHSLILYDPAQVRNQTVESIAVMSGATQDVLSLYDAGPKESEDIDCLLSRYVRAKLYSYQKSGVEWLRSQRRKKAGCLLADEMGLGKTLQVLAHLACVGDGPFLIIVPVTLLSTWEREINKFTPQLMGSIELVSYDKLRLHPDQYLHREYDTIVIDEAQVIKNRLTQKYKAIQNLRCKHRIILTGTPIENSLEDIWSHFLLLNPGMSVLYRSIMRSDGDLQHKIQLSSKVLSPFVLRRTKSEVQGDLPDKIEKDVYITLSEKERKIYDSVRRAVVTAIHTGVSGRVTSIALEGLLRMRQACVSSNILPRTLSHAGHIESTKLSVAAEFIQQSIANKQQILVFSQFVTALDELSKILDMRGIPYAVLTGETKDRQTPVDSFQRGDTKVFLLSLKAGGVGLNLTAASVVLFLDDWWNPAVESQAMDRAHRIGQRQNVTVLRLICENTVEEKILQLQEKKKGIVDLFESSCGTLTLDDIKFLVD